MASNKLRAYAARSDAGFNNQASAFAVWTARRGRSRSGIERAREVVWRGGQLADRVGQAERREIAAGTGLPATERLTLDVAVRDIHEERSANGNGLSVAQPVTAPLGAGMNGSIFSGNGGGFYGNGSGAIDPASGLPLVDNGAVFPTMVRPAFPRHWDRADIAAGRQLPCHRPARSAWRDRGRGQWRFASPGRDRRRLPAGRARLYGRLKSQWACPSLYWISPSARGDVVAKMETDCMVGGRGVQRIPGARCNKHARCSLIPGVRNVNVAEGLRLSTGAERLVVLSGGGQQATTQAPDWSAVRCGVRPAGWSGAAPTRPPRLPATTAGCPR